MMQETRQLPHSKEAEAYVLGCVFIDEQVVPEVAGSLSGNEFYIDRHKYIMNAVTNLYRSNVIVEPATVVEELKRLNLYDQSGGTQYILDLMDTVPTIANVSTFIQIIKEKALERELFYTVQNIETDILNGNIAFKDLIDSSENKINQVLNKRQTSPFIKIDKAADRVFDKIESTKGDHELSGLDTGFPPLNELTFGLQKGELVILAARPGVGKSAFALNIATNACEFASANVAFFSLEMSVEQLTMRLLSSASSLPLQKIRSNKMTKTETAMLLAAKQKISKFSLYLDESNTTDLNEIRAKCKKLKRENKLDLIIVDYLQLLNVGTARNNRVEEVGMISRGLKVLAKELEVPVLALSQLSRSIEGRQDKRPVLSDLRESGSIEQDADIVMFLSREMRPDPETKVQSNLTELIIAKNRQGMTDTIELLFKGAYSSFVLK